MWLLVALVVYAALGLCCIIAFFAGARERAWNQFREGLRPRYEGES